MSNKRPGVVILSGGLDSTVLLHYLVKEIGDPSKLRAISFNYGQRHSQELNYASIQASTANVAHRIIDLQSIRPLLGGSSQTDNSVPVPQGHYEDESMKKTVVPNRNMIMLALASAWAISRKLPAVYYGAHTGDHAIYPDCRQEFVEALGVAIKLADWHQVELEAPFKGMTKADIVHVGHNYNVPMHLTYSCYEGRLRHCGKCGTCVERKEAFTKSGHADPTTYE